MTRKRKGVVFTLFWVMSSAGCGLMMDDFSSGPDAGVSVSEHDTATGTITGSDTASNDVGDTGSSSTVDSATQTETSPDTGTVDSGGPDETDPDDTVLNETESQSSTDDSSGSDDIDDTESGCTGSGCIVCELGDVQCGADGTPERCNEEGLWEQQAPCTGTTPVCQPSRGECGCSPGDCPSGQACVGDVCEECGDETQICCEDGVCGIGLSCQDSLCQPCGGAGEACCDDDQCGDMLVCEIGICKSCGGTDEACCPVGTACIAGYCDTTDTCANGCLIDDVSYTDQQVNPANDCQLCDASSNAWQNQPNNTVCGDGTGLCYEGTCTSLTCENYCDIISNDCTSTSHSQYVASNICIASCQAFAVGVIGDTTGNTLACRLYHAIGATADQNTECPAAGPSGNGVCGGSCDGYCAMMMTYCSDRFVDDADCQSACATWIESTFDSYYYRPFETTSCALYGAQRATIDPDGYCIEASEARCP